MALKLLSHVGMRIIFFTFLVFSSVLTLAIGSKASAELRLYVFDCGEVEVRSLSLFTREAKDAFKQSKLANTCYLVKNGEKSFMWELGLPDSYISKKDGVSSVKSLGLINYKVHDSLREQLRKINVDPAQIQLAAVSHMHPDHTGNLELLKNAEVLVESKELIASQKNPLLQKVNFKPIGPRYDVFGDGSAVLLSAPGHTPGHQVLLLSLKKTGVILLAGDLYHFQSNREHSRVPVFNSDKEETLQSMEFVERLVRQTGAQVWMTHDPEQFKAHRLAPLFYE